MDFQEVWKCKIQSSGRINMRINTTDIQVELGLRIYMGHLKEHGLEHCEIVS